MKDERRKKIKITAKINKIENRKKARICETKSWLFTKINKIDNLYLEQEREKKLKLIKLE